MKVTVSIPDDIFNDAESLTHQLGTSRSDIYARALAAFINDHLPDKVTLAMNRAVDAIGAEDDAFLKHAARRVFDRSEW